MYCEYVLLDQRTAYNHVSLFWLREIRFKVGLSLSKKVGFICFIESPLRMKLFSFKIYDVINWKRSNYNTYIGQYLKK